MDDTSKGLLRQIRDTIGGFAVREYDYVGVTYPNSTTEVYTFKTGGASGQTIATITITYTDNTKDAISTVTKT